MKFVQEPQFQCEDFGRKVLTLFYNTPYVVIIGVYIQNFYLQIRKLIL